MDPQLTRQLIRRRLILENSSETKIKNEKKFKKIEILDIRPSNSIKNNFLEKIQKFESFNDNRVKIYQNIDVTEFRNNTELINKFNKLNRDPSLKLIPTTNKVNIENSKKVILNANKQKQDNFYDKIKQFESSSFVHDNKIARGNTINIDENRQSSNELCKKLITKSSKSDYNNWELDKNWVYYNDYMSVNNDKNQIKNKLSTRKKNIFSKN